MLWFVFEDVKRYLGADDEQIYSNEDYLRLEAEEVDDEVWVWYEDLNYCLQHDPDLEAFLE